MGKENIFGAGLIIMQMQHKVNIKPVFLDIWFSIIKMKLSSHRLMYIMLIHM